MSDLEKFKQLFDEIGVAYTETLFENEIRLEIDSNKLECCYNAGLDIYFSNEGKFKIFDTSGE